MPLSLLTLRVSSGSLPGFSLWVEGKTWPAVWRRVFCHRQKWRFEQEKEPDGERWHDWSDPYRKWRTRKGYMPGKILTLNGDLARRLTTDYGDTWALIGSNEPYAAIHQWGGLPGMPPGPAAIGARPYMGFDQVAEQEIMDEIRKRFKKATETP